MRVPIGGGLFDSSRGGTDMGESGISPPPPRLIAPPTPQQNSSYLTLSMGKILSWGYFPGLLHTSFSLPMCPSYIVIVIPLLTVETVPEESFGRQIKEKNSFFEEFF